MPRISLVGGSRSSGGVVGRSSSTTAAASGAGKDTQRELERMQRLGAGSDVFGIMNPGSAGSYQMPIPGVDFTPTWRTKTQQGFKFTINSARAGLNLQRGRIEMAHARMSESSLITHADDQAILPWDTVEQPIDLGQRAGNHWAASIQGIMFQGRLVLHSTGPFDVQLFAETSPRDPTLVQLPIVGPRSHLFEIYTVRVNGVEKLGFGHTLYDDLTGNVFGHIDSGSGRVDFEVWSAMQVPLPGDPVLVREGPNIYLRANDQLTTSFGATLSGSNALMATNLPFPYKAIGPQAVGGRPVRAYWLETELPSARLNRISSVSLFGTDYQQFETSIDGQINSVAKCLDGFIISNSERVIFTNGSEQDLRILHDVKHYPGYFYYVAGVQVVDHIPFAEVNRVPIEYDRPTLISNADYIPPPSDDPTYRALWRFDWEIGQWSQVSEWTQWAVSTGVGGNNLGYFGRLIVNNLVDGHVSAHMHTGIPYSPSSRYFHIGCTAGETNPMVRKFQEPVGTNPYGWRQNEHDFGEDGTIDFPAMLVPPGTEYMDKYLDAIEWGGQDTGGTGSQVTVWVAEGGRLDELDPPPLHAVFRHGLTHASRYIKFPANNTSMLFPQIRIKVERGSEVDKTPQALPVTIHGHLDTEERERPSWISKWLGSRRSKG